MGSNKLPRGVEFLDLKTILVQDENALSVWADFQTQRILGFLGSLAGVFLAGLGASLAGGVR